MKRSLFCLLLFFPLVALSALPSSAAVFERDRKASGDGLLTYDDVNQREWLDLGETLLYQFPGADIEAKYQSILAELHPGGMFESFSAATRSDVLAFAESAGINTATTEFVTNADTALNLIDLLGVTRTDSRTGRISSRGFINELSLILPGHPLQVEAIFDYFPPQPSFVGRAGVLIGLADLRSVDTTGALLFRHAVPEPSTVCSLAVACLSLVAIRN